VVYYDPMGKLRGGADEREHGTVKECRWHGSGWTVHLSDGQTIALAAVRCVGQTDEQGALKAAWSVREHGLDGTKNQARKESHNAVFTLEGTSERRVWHLPKLRDADPQGCAVNQ
jgi:hypothetical protein